MLQNLKSVKNGQRYKLQVTKQLVERLGKMKAIIEIW